MGKMVLDRWDQCVDLVGPRDTRSMISGGKFGTRKTRTKLATGAIFGGAFLAYMLLPSDRSGDVFATAAIVFGVSLFVATAVEATAGGVRNLIRVDILILW